MSAAQMLLAGSSVSAVATALNLSTATVKRYKAILDDGGLDALKKMSVGGRSSAIGARFGVQYSRVYTWQIATNLGLGHRLSKSSR
jgi:hypothetical protein